MALISPSEFPTVEIRQLDVLNGALAKVSAYQSCKLKAIKCIHPQGIMSQNHDFLETCKKFYKD